MTANIDTRWALGKKYLISQVTVKGDQGDSPWPQRMHVVTGWVAVTDEIVSWSFRSDGGYSRATWTQDGSAWIRRVAGGTGDGKEFLSSQVLRLDDDTLTIETSSLTIGGESQPTGPKVSLKRKQSGS